jgi:hypothetical protein
VNCSVKADKGDAIAGMHAWCTKARAAAAIVEAHTSGLAAWVSSADRRVFIPLGSLDAGTAACMLL